MCEREMYILLNCFSSKSSRTRLSNWTEVICWSKENSVDPRPLEEQSASKRIYPLLMERGKRASLVYLWVHDNYCCRQMIGYWHIAAEIVQHPNQSVTIWEVWKCHSPVPYLLLRGSTDFSGDLGQAMFSCAKPVKQIGKNGAQHSTMSLHSHKNIHAQKEKNLVFPPYRHKFVDHLRHLWRDVVKCAAKQREQERG